MIELTTLLRDRRISHPSSIVAASLREKCFTLLLRGYPWWRNPVGAVEQEEYTFDFMDLSDGSLNLLEIASPDDIEALEGFQVCPASELPWLDGSAFTIYGHQPLLRPLTLYAKLEEYLGRLRSIRKAEDFLNVCRDNRTPLRSFASVTGEQSYLIASGPDCVREVVCIELDEQNISYNVVGSGLRQPDKRIFVRFGYSWLLCEQASATLPSP